MLKSIFYIIVFIFTCPQVLKSQTYVPFPTAQDSVSWKMTEWSWGNKFESFLYFSEDTLINGKNYSKVYTGNYLFKDESNQLSYLIREENKQIYSRSISSGNESLWYDFSLNVSDTLIIDTAGYLKKAVVTEIDSIEFEDNIFRKRFLLSPLDNVMYPPVYHVEGVGNTGTGFFHPFGLGGIVDYGIATSCIFSPNTLFYKRQDATNEDCYVLIKETDINDIDGNELNVFPNPTNNFLNFSENILESSIEIYSLAGQKVFEEFYFSGKQIDISSLEKGIYFLKMKGSVNGFVKIVKL